MENVIANFDAIITKESIPDSCHFIAMGFSQGVSVATRWLARRMLPCKTLIIYAGKVPREFTPADFKQVERVALLIGDKDPYITEEIIAAEKAYLATLFKDKITFTVFNGKHEVHLELLLDILNN